MVEKCIMINRLWIKSLNFRMHKVIGCLLVPHNLLGLMT